MTASPLRLLVACLSFLLLGAARPSPAGAAARPVVAYVDVSDPYTVTAALRPWLEASPRVRAVDVTDALRRGRLGLRRSRALVVGSFAMADRQVREGLRRAAPVLRRFLVGGGTIVVLAQADEDAAALDWLPRGLVAERGERDGDAVLLVRPKHPLAQRPHRLDASALGGWALRPARVEQASSVVSVTDAFVRLDGFQVVASVAASADGAPDASWPALVVAAVGRGRVVLAQLAPDRALSLGADERTRDGARALLDNLLDYALRRHRAAGRKTKVAADAAPDPPFRAPGPSTVTVLVFRDDDGDGVLDEGEAPIADVTVTHAFTTATTDERGAAEVAVDPNEPGWIAVTVPDGHEPTTPWWVDAWALPHGGVRFGLRPVAFPVGPLVIAQLTDLHIGAKPLPVGRALFAEALAAVASHRPAATVVLATGDLTASGAPDELVAYRELLEGLPQPVLHAMGNHDLTRGPDLGMTYLRALGPWAYDREIAGHRFVVLYQRRLDHPAIAWARERIASSPLPVVLVIHHYPRRAVLDRLLAPNVQAVVSGDWHDAEVRRLPGGAVDVNSAPTLMGGWDHSPAAVRFVSIDRKGGIDGKGVVETSLRYLRVDERLAVVLPEAEADPAQRRVVVQAYDTRSPFDRVTFALDGSDPGSRVRARGSLAPCGTFAWCAELGAPLPEGRYALAVTARTEDGRALHAERVVHVAVRSSAPPSVDGAWPVFRGDAARSGHTREALEPPLAVVWASPAGGEVYAGGPVAADDGNGAGIVVLPLMDRASVGAARGGVVAFDLGDGHERWRYRSGSSVRHSPAIAQGLVVFQQTDGSTVALDLASGAERWRYDLAHVAPPTYAGYYALGGPLVVPSRDGQGGRVYVGPSAAPRVLDLATGEPLAALDALDGQPAVTYASPVRIGGLVVYPTRHRGLFAFRARPRGGTLLPAWRSPRLRLSATPVVFDGDVYALSHEGLLVVDGRRGKVRRRFPLAPGTSAASPVVDDASVYVPTADGALVALDRRSGAERWRFETGPAILDFLLYRARSRGNSSSPLLTRNGLLLFGGHDGFVYAVDRRTGAAVWSFDVGVPVPSAPALAGGTLLVADYGGVLYAFRAVGVPADGQATHR